MRYFKIITDKEKTIK